MNGAASSLNLWNGCALGLADGVVLEAAEGGAHRIASTTHQLTFARRGPHLDAAFAALAAGGDTARSMADHAPDAARRAEVYYALARLARRNMLAYTLRLPGEAAHLTLQPRGGELHPPVGASPVVLSRFAQLRRHKDRWLLDHPLSRPRLELSGAGALALLGALASPCDAETLADALPSLDGHLARAALDLLGAAGMTTPFRNGEADEERDEILTHWELPDLAFHVHSRFALDGPYGGTYRMRGRARPEPALRPTFAGTRHALAAPDLDALRRTDLPFAEVVEARRSVRAWDDEQAIRLDELAELLYRTARVDRTIPAGEQEATLRPTPSGGALWDLEVYAAVRRCDGLEPGLYHYEAGAHALCDTSAPTEALDAMLTHASAALGNPGVALPQVLLVMASRFRRLQWKYERVAYALTLKHVGVLTQALYLHATAMKLGGCALGGGNPEAFARATGNPFHVEGSVGEFAVGRPLAAPPAAGPLE